MAGAYCRYCGRRCFVDRVLPDNSWSGHMATCSEGMAHDRRVLGHDHTTAINPITDRRTPAMRTRTEPTARDEVLGWVAAERARMQAKHGPRTPADPGMSDREKFVILAEEVGELARALTYDHNDDENLRAELVQVAAVALAWLDSRLLQPAGGDSTTLQEPTEWECADVDCWCCNDPLGDQWADDVVAADRIASSAPTQDVSTKGGGSS